MTPYRLALLALHILALPFRALGYLAGVIAYAVGTGFDAGRSDCHLAWKARNLPPDVADEIIADGPRWPWQKGKDQCADS